MGKTDIGPKIGIDGEKEYKKQINEINNSLKTLGTEMKVVTSEFANNEKSEKSLIAQNKTLKKQTQELSEKLKLNKDKLAEVRKKYDETSPQVQYYQRQVNETQTALNKANNQLERNNELLSEKREAVLKGIATGFTAIATAATAAVTALAKMTLDSGKWADDLNTLSKQTGISTEDLQKYQFAASRVDVSVDTLTGSMAKLTKNMSNARKGTGDAADAFSALGVDITDANGSLRDNEDVFKETIKALGQVENETERDAMAMQIFGKSAQDLNPLILGGADALEQLGAEAEAAGLILDQDSIDKLNGVQDAVDGLKASAEGAGHLFSVGFAGPISDAINVATGYIQKLTASFDGGFAKMGEAVGEILTDITAKINEYLPEVINLGMSIITTLIEGVVKMLPDIVQTAADIITTIIDSLTESIPDLIPVAVEAVLTLADTLIDNIDMLVDASFELIMALADGLIDSLPTLLEKAPVIIQKLVTAISENAPKLLEAAFDIIMALALGILENLPQILTAAYDIVKTLLQGLGESFINMVEMGGHLVEGFITGWKDKFEWAWNQLLQWFKGVIQKVKDWLGIHSPSRRFAELGQLSAEGFGEGWESSFGAVARDINGSLGSLLPDSTANIGVVSSMRGNIGGIRSALADSVNALGAMGAANANTGNLNIVIQANGREFYRATIDDFRLINSQNPIILNDF